MSGFILLAVYLQILLFVYLVFVGYPQHRVDRFRGKLFELRDMLFDEARHGNLSFDDEAYVMLRDLMNGLIRNAERIGPLQLAAVSIKMRKLGVKPALNKRFESATKKLSKDKRERLEKYMDVIHMIIIEQLMTGSVFTLVPATLAGVALRGKDNLRKMLSKRFSRQIEELEQTSLVVSV